MSEPLLARALLTAAAPAGDYESIVGDLHEEYVGRLRRVGRVQADLWYWDQTLRSIPSLFTYSRSCDSVRRQLATAAIVLGLLVAMLFAKDALDRLIDAIRIGMPVWLYFICDWLIAAIFGALLAAIVRYHPVRLALLAAGFLVAAFAAPILLGVSPQISLPAWLLLCGSIPAMCAGAATFRLVRNH